MALRRLRAEKIIVYQNIKDDKFRLYNTIKWPKKYLQISLVMQADSEKLLFIDVKMVARYICCGISLWCFGCWKSSWVFAKNFSLRLCVLSKWWLCDNKKNILSFQFCLLRCVTHSSLYDKLLPYVVLQDVLLYLPLLYKLILKSPHTWKKTRSCCEVCLIVEASC